MVRTASSILLAIFFICTAALAKTVVITDDKGNNALHQSTFFPLEENVLIEEIKKYAHDKDILIKLLEHRNHENHTPLEHALLHARIKQARILYQVIQKVGIKKKFDPLLIGYLQKINSQGGIASLAEEGEDTSIKIALSALFLQTEQAAIEPMLHAYEPQLIAAAQEYNNSTFLYFLILLGCHAHQTLPQDYFPKS
ncbi:MAG: hypothetical protein H6679_04485 [Epsilonproteobacteria bacterium]|nr:hypothetical protein [Campylobacterota bacterium]